MTLKQEILDLLDELKRNSNGSKLGYTYLRAIKSLRAHSSPIINVNDLLAVKHFGPKICEKVAQKLNQPISSCSQPLPSTSSTSSSSNDGPSNGKRKQQSKVRTELNIGDMAENSPLRKKRVYCPKPKSGAYSILIALYQANLKGSPFLHKEELMKAAQNYCDQPMASKRHGSFYSGWNAIKTLTNHRYVEREMQRIAKYSLTSDGYEMAKKIVDYELNRSNPTLDPDVFAPFEEGGSDDDRGNGNFDEDEESEENGDQRSFERVTANDADSDIEIYVASGTQCKNYTEIRKNKRSANEASKKIFEPNTFDVVLLIDSREQNNNVPQELKKTSLLTELSKQGVNCEMRALPVGDFAWILRTNMPSTSSSQLSSIELLADYIIERKRADDLAKSIIDQRWPEQKYRLKHCGVKHPMYLIEELKPDKLDKRYQHSLPYETLQQAVIDAKVIDNFVIKYTKSQQETISLLAMMTKNFENFYQSKPIFCSPRHEINGEFEIDALDENIVLMTYSEFSRHSTKVSNFTVKEMFIKHLLQVKGISVAKAKEVTKHYQTISSLNDAYSICSNDNEKRLLLSSIKVGQKNFGRVLSEKIYNVYNA